MVAERFRTQGALFGVPAGDAGGGGAGQGRAAVVVPLRIDVVLWALFDTAPADHFASPGPGVDEPAGAKENAVLQLTPVERGEDASEGRWTGPRQNDQDDPRPGRLVLEP